MQPTCGVLGREVDLDPSQVAVVGHDMAGLVDEVQSRPRANRDGVASLKTLPSLTELIGDPHQPAKRIPDDRFANAATDLTTVDRDPSLAMCEIRGAPGRYLRTNDQRPVERVVGNDLLDANSAPVHEAIVANLDDGARRSHCSGDFLHVERRAARRQARSHMKGELGLDPRREVVP